MILLEVALDYHWRNTVLEGANEQTLDHFIRQISLYIDVKSTQASGISQYMSVKSLQFGLQVQAQRDV